MQNYTTSRDIDEDRLINQEFEELKKAYLASPHRKKIEVIERAYRFARNAHAGARRISGEPFIMHPLAVARIVISEMGLGSTSICAALLHDVVEDTDYTTDDLERLFGPRIARIVDGLTKISGGIFGDKASLQAENFRKLLLSLSADVRVVLIKMADRLHNMRTLSSMPAEKQLKISGETLYIYAPLAHRLGLFKIKEELEDLAFRHEHPERYAEIMRQVASSRDRREQMVDKFVEPIRRKLDAAGFTYEIKARVKSAYSIYRKMERKHLKFDDIYDVYAVRVIFENDDEETENLRCWQIYTFFSEGNRIHPDRMRDWITTPKSNGYRALHLTVMGPEGKWIEVQIRSRKMDDIAELGYAAHWKYKTGEYPAASPLDDLMAKVKEILSNPTPNAIDFLDTVTLNLFSSDIYVFTPRGDLITLPKGATVLDMAFEIHTDLGRHCVAGKISHRLVARDHQLTSGDQVEIITSESQHPEAAWLRSCRTAKAQNCLRSMLRRDKAVLTAHGRTLFNDFAEKEGLQPTPETMRRILTHYGLSTPEELYMMMASDEINLAAPREMGAKTRSNPSMLRKLLRNPFTSKRRNKKDGTEVVLHPGAEHPDYVIATCCTPLPGDDVTGFMAEGECVVVHKSDCPELKKLKATYGSRLVAPRWEGMAEVFTAAVEIEGIDRRGLLAEVLAVVSGDMGLNITEINCGARQTVFHCTITVQADSLRTIKNLCSRIRKIKNIESAKRI